MAREAMRNVKSLLAAILAGNPEAVNQLLSDEFFYVNSTGTTANKAQFVARLQGGDLKYTDLALRHPKVRSYSDNVVINAELHIEGTTKGGPIVLDVILTQVWAREPDGLRLTTHHTTRKA